MFIGSTDDGHTFAARNTPIPSARRALTAAGFTARPHQRRTLYLLPPGRHTAETHERAGNALYGLLAHTLDFVDLAWTTRWPPTSPARADVRIAFADEQVTATARTGTGTGTGTREILIRHGFLPTPNGHALLTGLSERDRVNAVVRTESHLHTERITVHVSLGFPTPDAIPPKPGRTPAPTLTPGRSAQPRTR
ncbi:hypothetical protein [Streptomyces sp. NPDC088789]|uniref:hypothetical protein n=1 Tax=Streptomyces sp. NPDC088789 TaxID=3365899 RepID=UPI0037F126E8